MSAAEDYGALQQPIADYGAMQQPTPGYLALQQGDEVAGGGGSAKAAKPAKPSPKPKPKPKPDFKVRVRVDDMGGSLAGNSTILDQVTALFKAAGVEVDIAYGLFTQRELEFDGVIPVLIVSEPATTDQADRWIANQDAMNLEILKPPSKLEEELPPATTTSTATREIIGSTRVIATTGTKPVNVLHAPVVISAGRLLTDTKANVPAKFQSQVFVNEISITISHECGHAFGLAVSAKGGVDVHPSDGRNVMSRDTFDSLGGTDKLPKGEANWEKLLKSYQLPTFAEKDSKSMQARVTELKGKIKRKENIQWKFPPSKKGDDRIPDPKNFAEEPKEKSSK